MHGLFGTYFEIFDISGPTGARLFGAALFEIVDISGPTDARFLPGRIFLRFLI